MIKDLLWACVVCGACEGIRPANGEMGIEVCQQCGARYRRGVGSHIVVEKQGGEVQDRHAAEWAALLPPVDATGSAACTVRVAYEDRPIRAFGTYWGRYEHFADPIVGTLSLTETHLQFQPEDPTSEVRFNWNLLELTAIQLSSSTLQLKAKRHPVVTIRFTISSPKLWEERLQIAVRAAHKRAGHGDVIEFQPRIVTG